MSDTHWMRWLGLAFKEVMYEGPIRVGMMFEEPPILPEEEVKSTCYYQRWARSSGRYTPPGSLTLKGKSKAHHRQLRGQCRYSGGVASKSRKKLRPGRRLSTRCRTESQRVRKFRDSIDESKRIELAWSVVGAMLHIKQRKGLMQMGIARRNLVGSKTGECLRTLADARKEHRHVAMVLKRGSKRTYPSHQLIQEVRKVFPPRILPIIVVGWPRRPDKLGVTPVRVGASWKGILLGAMLRTPLRIDFYHRGEAFEEFSNFHPSPIQIKGVTWPTVEHFFQASKFEKGDHQRRIRESRTPREACTLGRAKNVPIRKDWEVTMKEKGMPVKEQVMLEGLLAKFTQHPRLRSLLLSTGNAPIHEHSPVDWYWGDGGDDTGKNRLGALLVRLRMHLRFNPGEVIQEQVVVEAWSRP